MKDPSKDIFGHLKLRFLRTWAFRAVFVCFFGLQPHVFPLDFLPGTFYNCQNSVQSSFNVVILVIQRYIPYFYSKRNSEGERLTLWCFN